jgi:hypothetical protein
MKNVGKLDQIVRLILGFILLSLVFFGPQTLWGLVGLIFIVTAAFKFCPAYSLFNFKTCEVEKK